MVAQVRAPSPRALETTVSGETGRAHRGEAGLVVGPVVHRVVGDVHDVVATDGAIGKDRRDAGHGIAAAVDDTVEIDQQEETHRPIVAGRSAAAYDGADAGPLRPRPARRHAAPPDRRNEPAPRDADGGRGGTPPALIGRLRGVDPGHDHHRARLRRPARARAPQRADRDRPGRPLQRRPDGRRGHPDPHRRRPAARRRRRHGDPAGRDRRPRPAPRVAAARRPDGGLGVAARPAGGRSAGLAVGRQPAAGARPETRHRGQPEGRRSGRDRPAAWKPGRGATTKKGNPRRAPKGGGTDRMPP